MLYISLSLLECHCEQIPIALPAELTHSILIVCNNYDMALLDLALTYSPRYVWWAPLSGEVPNEHTARGSHSHHLAAGWVVLGNPVALFLHGGIENLGTDITGSGSGYCQKGDWFLSQDEAECDWHFREYEWISVSLLSGVCIYMSIGSVDVYTWCFVCGISV